jgi:phospholipid transport system substrate-binding protein
LPPEIHYNLSLRRSGYKEVLVCLLVFTTLSIVSHAYAGEPSSRIQTAVDKVIAILKDQTLAGDKQTAARRAAIRQVVGEIFDFEEMAKRTLAQHWKNRSAAEQQEFVTLFADFLEKNYIKKIESYKEEKISIAAEKVENGRALVRTIIVTGEKTEIPIEYKMYVKAGVWRIYDISIEGVSLVNNYRSQFASMINKKSYEELRRQLQQRSL